MIFEKIPTESLPREERISELTSEGISELTSEGISELMKA